MTGGLPLSDIGLGLGEMQAELERLRARRRGSDFASAAAFAGAAPSFEIGDAGQPARAPRPEKQTPSVTRAAPSPFTTETPDRAPTAPASQDTRQIEDEGLRKRRRRGGGGGGGDAAPAVRSKPVAPTAKARPAASQGPERSSVVVKSALAGGSQAAVVKLASFGAGRARAHALMSYQTDKGELAAERHDGIILKGAEDISALASEWGAESSGREPSKDSLAFTAAFDEPLTNETIRESLHEALRGHVFAWRAETRGDQTHVHVVALAAGSQRNENGKADRFYPNKKSTEGLYDRIETAFDRDAKIEVQGWAHGIEGATRQLARLTRAGELDAETSSKQDLKEEAFQRYERRSGKSPSDNFNPNLEMATSWRRQMRSNEPRDFAHVVFSAKPSTDKDAFLDATRATLAKEFAGHEYIFVLHTNREHIHVHAAIRMENERGERLHPNIVDFRRWRETLAEEARERQIPMEATSRFDEANVPAYKLKDIRMVERGTAPESVRRRVEAVKERAIHRPTRDEGRAHASRVAREWGAVNQSLAATAAMPPLREGALRLYRAEPKNAPAHATVMFTADRAAAETLAAHNGGQLVYLDVSRERLAEVKRANINPDTMFAVPARVAAERQPIPHADLHRLKQRAERAVSHMESRTIKDGGQMRTAETMTYALDDMRKRLDNISSMVEPDKKQAFEEQRTTILDAAQKAIEAQKRLEAKPVEMAGDKYVQPAPIETTPQITHERKGSEIHYSRHDDTGQRVALAFVDKGKQLDVNDWNHKETVLAALRVAASKWETINITGNEKYKETVVQLAAEHGFKITNPELQDRIEKARADIEAQRPAMREGMKEKEPAKETAPASAESQGKPAEAKQTSAVQTPADAPTGAANQNAPKEKERESETAPVRADEKGPGRTDAERVIALDQVRERLDQEAKRETQEARQATESHKPNPVASSEAAAARDADRAADENPRREIPANPNATERVRELRAEQSKVLTEDQQAKDKQAQQDRANLEREKQRETERQSEKPRHRE
ncbi:hypothetical protein SS37A_38770 (plasmid) [Methylocystis iwaonis]|uniref:Large polyvalent protein-associated domain-containing protein n=1 Tax=Methylocystis iwaonis TaxID=2885079 RepID=A0ABN6VQP8_9HYPH|nr:hypothetical protein SS37A_38770 [Methylocystis iwaonis]